MTSSMNARTIAPQTLRRFVLGRQGMWPGRRWKGKRGTEEAARAVQALQIDPVSVVAQSHDIVLWGRVLDYKPELLHQLAYDERKFFDYGGHLDLYPMEDFPYWRPLMERRRTQERWMEFVAERHSLVDEVRRTIAERGPVRSRELDGNRVDHYRSGKDTGVALYYLWLVGELMTHRREGRERVYDLTERIAPEEHRRSATEADAIDHFVQKAISQRSIIVEQDLRAALRGLTEPRLSDEEADCRFHDFVEAGELCPVRVDGTKALQFVRCDNLALLDELAAGGPPADWKVHGPTTEEEVVFLSPLEFVSARGRAKKLFGFDYTWEIYRPDHLRRHGPYTLPVLYGDRLVARIDMRLDRAQKLLVVNGLWIEEWFDADGAFGEALAGGLRRFALFLGADRFDGTDKLAGLPKAVAEALRGLPR